MPARGHSARPPRKPRAAALRINRDSNTLVERVPSYLDKLDPAVRDHFAAAVPLSTFLDGVRRLTPAQRRIIVKQALLLIEQNYAHLPLKRAMHAVDPVQRLKLLLQNTELAAGMTEVEFHRELTDIFTSVRDLHTNYLLPSPFNGVGAFLPFMVEDYNEAGARRYLVTHVAKGFTHPTFVAGVEIVHWNGMPIERAVSNNAQRFAGSNRDARHARGVQTLTQRALRIAPPPDEEWVVIGYRTLADALAEVRIDWQINPPLPTGQARPAAGDERGSADEGLDLEQDLIQGMRLALFAPQVVAADRKVQATVQRGDALQALESRLPKVFEAKVVKTAVGEFGHLRIRTFNEPNVDLFVAEFTRLIGALPQAGLILDVRGNGGGIIMNGERILQTLTPRPVEPEPLQFLNTALNLEICLRNGRTSGWADLSAWVESMQQALQTAAIYSAGFPISGVEACNSIGQKYFGPVVLIIDALCYSTTDIFAAGFQDHEIGPILGVHERTGAGGANVWEHRFFVDDILPNSVYQPLPNDAGMRVAIRRTLRVGKRAGMPVEDLGVIADEVHPMTKADLLQANVDLLEKAGAMLAKLPARDFNVTVSGPSSAGQTLVSIKAKGMTRVDAYVDDRPQQSVDLKNGSATLKLASGAIANAILEIRGFDGKTLAARFRTGL